LSVNLPRAKFVKDAEKNKVIIDTYRTSIWKGQKWRVRKQLFDNMIYAASIFLSKRKLYCVNNPERCKASRRCSYPGWKRFPWHTAWYTRCLKQAEASVSMVTKMRF